MLIEKGGKRVGVLDANLHLLSGDSQLRHLFFEWESKGIIRFLPKDRVERVALSSEALDLLKAELAWHGYRVVG